jgi:hypothetical protein
MGSRRIAPRIINLGTSWRCVVSFTPWSLYPRGKSPRYPSVRRVGRPQIRSGSGGEDKDLRHCPSRELNPGRPSRSLVTILTELPRLRTGTKLYQVGVLVVAKIFAIEFNFSDSGKVNCCFQMHLSLDLILVYL